MPTLAAKIAPQRSSQYSALASTLAEPELRASPLAPLIAGIRPVTLAAQAYLLLELAGEPDQAQQRALWQLGATNEFYWYFDRVGSQEGPFLKPLHPLFDPFFPSDLVEARRYRGKTNELFTTVMLNVARWSRPTATPTESLRVLDPLMGGGTTLFVALRHGYDVVGIEKERQDVETTDVFLRQFLDGENIKYRRKDERVGAAPGVTGRRWLYTIQHAARQLHAILIAGDTTHAPALLANIPGGARADGVVADLPYGIQHHGQLHRLLQASLPAWAAVAQPETVLALAWDATRLPRATMIEWVEEAGQWRVLQGGIYDTLAHAVDRVIKQRDLIVAQRVA
ncbi:MAG TPA: hypothetical protein VER55_02665 [Ardenticatenaceae bacterium]|nr:hypothetical protein [Ardenticatenaceae bacterium]